MAQSVKRPSLGFRWGDDLRVVGSRTPALGYPLSRKSTSLSLSPSAPHPPHPLALPYALSKINKEIFKKRKKKPEPRSGKGGRRAGALALGDE